MSLALVRQIAHTRHFLTPGSFRGKYKIACKVRRAAPLTDAEAVAAYQEAAPHAPKKDKA